MEAEKQRLSNMEFPVVVAGEYVEIRQVVIFLSVPVSRSTQIIASFRPGERRHEFATALVFSKCHKNMPILTVRRLSLGSSSIIDSLHFEAVRNPCLPHRALSNSRFYLMTTIFPSTI
ncbi:hypothetical protein Nepgr_031231 [Nepenthes gracilis]|uniref:Uncharacterized protein n=1 Tax=Nepenthes gracilis TaxID=150966 RepID=A0AAD3TG57_NEPGR|nr:hypothetical protein Nepgr_031231 [Nepenthes gracilis]